MMPGADEIDTYQQSMLVEAEPGFPPVPGGWGKQGYTDVLLQGRRDDAEERARHGLEKCCAEIEVAMRIVGQENDRA